LRSQAKIQQLNFMLNKMNYKLVKIFTLLAIYLNSLEWTNLQVIIIKSNIKEIIISQIFYLQREDNQFLFKFPLIMDTEIKLIHLDMSSD